MFINVAKLLMLQAAFSAIVDLLGAHDKGRLQLDQVK
jgi:hypothetical protein